MSLDTASLALRALRMAFLIGTGAVTACTDPQPPAEDNRGPGGSHSTEVIGQFNISLNEARTDLGTPPSTTILGKIYDGPNPVPHVAVAIGSSGPCTVYRLAVPFCEGGCTKAVCVAENTCQPYPQLISVGDVTVSGVLSSDGSASIRLLGSNNSYRTSGDTHPVYPGFAEGDTIRLTATGGDDSPFTITAVGVAPLDVAVNSLTLSPHSALELAWTAATGIVSSTVNVNLNLSHHGGSKGYLQCQGVADSGALTIAADLMSQLIDLGVAGFPTLRITRESVGYAPIAAGRVAMVISSEFARTVSVDGFTSCETNADCAATQTCHAETKLCQ